MKVIDMHCDTISEIRYRLGSEQEQSLRENSLQIDLMKMKKGGYLLQNFALFVDLAAKEDPFSSVMHLSDVFYQEMDKNKDLIRQVRCYQDIEKNSQEGIMSALLTVEEGGVCKGDLAFLRTLYRLGVRMMTLTWNYPNEIGNPNLYQEDIYKNVVPQFDGSRGLTETGLAFLEEMERLGMIIDVSHLSDAGFLDVLQHTTKPFVASHSNARALCRHGRNLTDEMIRAIAERGGLIGLNYFGMFLEEPNKQGEFASTVKRMAEHARHIIYVGGKECLGLGSDFDGISGALEMQDCSMLPLLEKELRKQGFHESEIEGIFYKNALKLYQQVLS